jgi:hypothetical protein
VDVWALARADVIVGYLLAHGLTLADVRCVRGICRRRVLDGRSDHNIPFDDLRGLLLRLGFEVRISGDHHVFGKDGIREIIDIQPQRDGKAKVYQVRQHGRNIPETEAKPAGAR